MMSAQTSPCHQSVSYNNSMTIHHLNDRSNIRKSKVLRTKQHRKPEAQDCPNIKRLDNENTLLYVRFQMNQKHQKEPNFQAFVC